MKIGILGTGMVGEAHAAKLSMIGHDVMIGTRDVARTLARTEPDSMGNPPFSEWHGMSPKVKLGTFAEAATHGEIIINAAHGTAALEALGMAGKENLDGKILIDISNPLDFSKGMPPSLSVCNTDSLGEEIQAAFPRAKVVKALNTVSVKIQVNPRELANGDHDLFVCGNDAEAKQKVIEYLKNWYGWREIVDLGDITGARGMEMVLPMWLNLWGKLQTPAFNFKIVKQA